MRNRTALIYSVVGATGGILSALLHRHLKKQGFEHIRLVLANTAKELWAKLGKAKQKDLSANALYIVGTPLTRDNLTLKSVLQVINRQLDNCSVTYIDFQRGSYQALGALAEIGVEIFISTSMQGAYLGPQDQFARKWARIAAVGARDRSALPATRAETTFAQAVSASFKKTPKRAFAAVLEDDDDYFDEPLEIPSPPGKLVDLKNVGLVEKLSEGIDFRQLAMLEDMLPQYEYMVGVAPRGDYWRVVVSTNWNLALLPAAIRVGLKEFDGRGAGFSETIEMAGIDGYEKALRRAYKIAHSLQSEGVIKFAEKPKTSSVYEMVSVFFRKVLNARIAWRFPQHGIEHTMRVIETARTLGSMFCNSHDQKLLEWAALLHDVGNGASDYFDEITPEEARRNHAALSGRMVREWASEGLFRGILELTQIEEVAVLCEQHCKTPVLPENPRLRKLCVLLRIADVLDIDQRRGQKNDNGIRYEKLRKHRGFSEQDVMHWSGLRAISAIRLRYNNTLTVEVLVSDPTAAEFQLQRLSQALTCLTGFMNWNVSILVSS